jgi:hypothetical protein
MDSVIQPKRPIVQNWRRATWWKCPPQLAEFGYPVEAWEHPSSGLFCLSALEVAHDPGKPALGPEYHLSVTMNGQRCTAADALFALASFGLEDAKEDNHVPNGRVRNFWRPVGVVDLPDAAVHRLWQPGFSGLLNPCFSEALMDWPIGGPHASRWERTSSKSGGKRISNVAVERAVLRPLEPLG